jgi:cytochrome b561
MASVNKAAYSVVASYYHWMVAVPVLGCVGSVLKAQDSPKNEKGKWMWRHKSFGLLTGLIVAPRLAYRIFNRSAVRLRIISLSFPSGNCSSFLL